MVLNSEYSEYIRMREFKNSETQTEWKNGIWVAWCILGENNLSIYTDRDAF